MLFDLNGCDNCGLKKEWPKLYNPKIPVISPSALSVERIVGIGEGPGEEEDKTSNVFVGTAGQYLRRYIPGNWSSKIHWTNIVRCRPPNNRAPKIDEIACCSNYLEEDLSRINPHAVIGFGGVALDYFWPGMTITSARGTSFPFKLANGEWRWFYSTFHPSYVSRSVRERDKVNTVLPVFKSDLERFFNSFPRFLTPPNPPPIPKYEEVLYPKSVEEVKNLFNRLKEPFGFDIETSKLKPYHRDGKIVTAAFGDKNTIFAFPVDWPGTLTRWGNEALDWCLSQNRRWVGHNSGFELTWAWWNYPGCNLLTPYEDSMARARVKYGRKTLLSLDDQTKLTLGTPIKDITGVDSKKLFSYPLEKVLYYNALDAWASCILHEEIDLTPVEETVYNRLVRATRTTVTAEILGLNVNLQSSAELKKELNTKKLVVEEKARHLREVRKFQEDKQVTLVLSSSMNVGICLAEYCGLNLPRTDGGKQYSTDEELLSKYIENPLVDYTLEFREINKQISTYVEPILNGKQLGVDGLIHPSYTTTLTATGRLSCNDPNIQNWPVRKHKEVRKQVVAPKGYVLAAFDFGQIEARLLAMAANDKRLLQSFYNHEDVHAKWLNRVIQLHPKYLERLARISGQTEEKAVWKAGRTAIKTDFVFANFYGSEASSVANRTEIPYQICVQLLKEFWEEYAGVKLWLNNALEFYQSKGYIQTITGLVRNEILNGLEPVNNPIQGAAAHVMLEAQIALWELAIKLDDFNFIPRISVHDDISFYIAEDSDLEKKLETIGKEMVKPRFDFSICPLLVEAKVGYNWYEMEEIGKWEGEYISNAA